MFRLIVLSRRLHKISCCLIIYQPSCFAVTFWKNTILCTLAAYPIKPDQVLYNLSYCNEFLLHRWKAETLFLKSMPVDRSFVNHDYLAADQSLIISVTVKISIWINRKMICITGKLYFIMAGRFDIAQKS